MAETRWLFSISVVGKVVWGDVGANKQNLVEHVEPRREQAIKVPYKCPCPFGRVTGFKTGRYR